MVHASLRTIELCEDSIHIVGGMTDELGGSHITEYVSIGPKNYAIRTADGKQIVKVKGFTLNYVASNQLNFDVMKDMAISDEQHSIKIVGPSQIEKDLKRRQIITLPSSKSYKRIFDKRVRNTKNLTSLPFGFSLIHCLDSCMYVCMYVLIILYN